MTRLGAKASPDGQITAALFAGDCGATTGYSSQVALAHGADLRPGRAVFIADDDRGKAAIGPDGGPLIEADWIGPRKLRIRYAQGARIFRQYNAEDGVKIVYETISR